MKNSIKLLLDNKPVKAILFTLLSFAATFPIVRKMLGYGYLSYSDYSSSFGLPYNLSKYLFVWNEDIGGHLSVTTNLFELPSALLQRFLAYFIPGHGDAFILWGSLAFVFLSVYMLLKHFYSNRFAAICGALIFIYSNFILSSVTFGWPMIGFLPLGSSFFMLYFGMKYLEGAQPLDLLYACLFSIGSFLLVQFTVLSFVVLVIRMIVRGEAKMQWKRFFALGIGSAVLSAWWILPFIASTLWYQFAHYAFDVIETVKQVALKNGYVKALLLKNFEPGGISNEIAYQSNILSYVFGLLLIVIVLSGSLVPGLTKQLRQQKYTALSLIFIFLTFSLGGVSIVYLFLFKHVPLFYIFRDVAKFAPFYLLGLCYLFMFLMQYLHIRQSSLRSDLLAPYKINAAHVVGIVCVLLAIATSYPLATGDLHGLLRPIQVPAYYELYVQQQSQDKTLGSNLVLPSPQWFSHFDWYPGGYQMQNPLKTNAVDPVIYDEFNFVNLRPVHSTLLKDVQLQDFESIFDSIHKLSIKTIALQNDQVPSNIDLRFVDRFVAYAKRLGYTNDISVSQVGEITSIDIGPNLRMPKVSGENVTFQKINPTLYRFRIDNLNEEQEIILSESYNSGWSLQIIPPTDTDKDWCTPLERYEIQAVLECEHENSFFKPLFWPMFYSASFADITHQSVGNSTKDESKEDGYANAWTLNADQIRSNVPIGHYIENEDGTVSIEGVLYYKPQSFVYAGLVLATLGLLLLFIWVSTGQRLYLRTKHKKIL